MFHLKRILITCSIVSLSLSSIQSVATELPVTIPEKVGMSTSVLTTADAVINQAIKDKDTPGAVLLVAHKGMIVYEKAYGNRMVKPRVEKMTLDTMFDMASLTKPSATATGIMILAQEGKLNVNDKVSKYIPGFEQNGKDNITLAHLLTHSSGLKPDGSYVNKHMGYDGVIKDIISMSTSYPTGTRFVYSDLGYITLGEIIRRVSGKPENEFVAEKIYEPLGLTDTGYLPPERKWHRVAPTEFRNGKWLRGQVHDPSADEMGGVAGHAGLFSTADDMAVLCQMFLNDGEYDGVRILQPETVKLMSTNQSPIPEQGRAFGWDMSSRYSSQRGTVFPRGIGYGHTGWTGTSVWIDPPSETIVILLCNRNHPSGGDVTKLRSTVATIVANSIIRPIMETTPKEAK